MGCDISFRDISFYEIFSDAGSHRLIEILNITLSLWASTYGNLTIIVFIKQAITVNRIRIIVSYFYVDFKLQLLSIVYAKLLSICIREVNFRQVSDHPQKYSWYN